MADVEVMGTTKAFLEQSIGQTIASFRKSGTRLLIKLRNGFEFDAGDISGQAMVDPQAVQIRVEAFGTQIARNLQASLQSQAGTMNSLNTNKASAADLPKIRTGRVTHFSGFNGQNMFRDVTRFENVFPAGYFATPPVVQIAPVTSVPTYIQGVSSVLSVTTRSFSISAWSSNSDDARIVFCYIAMEV